LEGRTISSAEPDIIFQSLVISSMVVLGEVMVKRITYLFFSEAGTACILPILNRIKLNDK
jgi:hypothetical protein